MNWYYVFSILSGIFTAASFTLYIHAIVKKGCKPAKASWIIWSILDTITAAGMLLRRETNGQIIVCFFGAIIVAYLARKYGDPEWHWSDKASAVGAGISMLFLFGQPETAIIFSLLANVIAAYPTFRNAWLKPHHESLSAWIVTVTGSVCALLSVSHWSIASGAQPVAFFGIQGLVLTILLFRR